MNIVVAILAVLFGLIHGAAAVTQFNLRILPLGAALSLWCAAVSP